MGRGRPAPSCDLSSISDGGSALRPRIRGSRPSWGVIPLLASAQRCAFTALAADSGVTHDAPGLLAPIRRYPRSSVISSLSEPIGTPTWAWASNRGASSQILRKKLGRAALGQVRPCRKGWFRPPNRHVRASRCYLAETNVRLSDRLLKTPLERSRPLFKGIRAVSREVSNDTFTPTDARRARASQLFREHDLRLHPHGRRLGALLQAVARPLGAGTHPPVSSAPVSTPPTTLSIA